MKVLYIHTGKVLLYNATFGNTTVTQGNTALLKVTLPAMVLGIYTRARMRARVRV